jgi:two-component system sensor histidine kinase ChvG
VESGRLKRAALPSPGLRGKLVLVALVLLVIPWAGYSYITATERLLREQQERQLMGAVRAVAAALHDRPRLATLREDSPDGDAARAEVRALVTGIARTGLRIWVIDNRLQLIAVAGDIADGTQSQAAESTFGIAERAVRAVLRPLLAHWLDAPDLPSEEFIPDDVVFGGREVERALDGAASLKRRPGPGGSAPIVTATHPVWIGEIVAGVAIVEESTGATVSFRHLAIERLIAVTLIAFGAAALVLLAFASRLSVRLRRLRDEAEHAIDSRGHARALVTAEHARDEIGDLSRSFSLALTRLADYNAYLEDLARRLAHELRTPIAVVRSSLDNLRLKTLPADATVYLERAEGGLQRLDTVLTRMAEASRLEQAVRSGERERYDAKAVLAGCVAGYAAAYPASLFELQLPEHPVMLNGAPDLYAQMLDKLVANAVDFSAAGSPIDIALALHGTTAVLTVRNHGPLLPENLRLFESMQSARGAQARDIHLGLGLYIVRLIAEFHRGRASAANLPDGSGVEFSVEIPTLVVD